MGVIQRGVDRKRVGRREKKEVWLLEWRSWARQQGPGVPGSAPVGPGGVCRGLCLGRIGARFQLPGWWPSGSVGRKRWQLPSSWALGFLPQCETPQALQALLMRIPGLAQGRGNVGLQGPREQQASSRRA